MAGRKRKSKLSYIVKSMKIFNEYETQDLNDAYEKAVVLSKTLDTVTVEEVNTRTVVKFKGGKVCHE